MARKDEMKVYRVPIAMMCVTCRRPYWSQQMNPYCEVCGDVTINLVFQCECRNGPVFAVAPNGLCEYCGRAIISDGADGENLEKLHELLERQKREIVQN